VNEYFLVDATHLEHFSQSVLKFQTLYLLKTKNITSEVNSKFGVLKKYMLYLRIILFFLFIFHCLLELMLFCSLLIILLLLRIFWLEILLETWLTLKRIKFCLV